MEYIKKIKRKYKLKGMPKVYYFNLDCDYDRKNFMESQFKKYGIQYERVSQSIYTKNNLSDWCYKFENPDIILEENLSLDGSCMYPANVLSHLEFMKRWLDTTNDEYLIVMEDDYDLSLIDYWHFDWTYLMNNLPPDWDAFKLNDDHMYKIRFFIRPIDKTGFSNFGAMLFKRDFVKRILSIYYSKNKKITIPTSNWAINNNNLDKYCVDFVFTQIGSIYTAPLITTEASLCRSVDDPLGANSSVDVFAPIQRACHQWWRNERVFFTLDDFFYYDKPNDRDMTIYIDNQIV